MHRRNFLCAFCAIISLIVGSTGIVKAAKEEQMLSMSSGNMRVEFSPSSGTLSLFRGPDCIVAGATASTELPSGELNLTDPGFTRTVGESHETTGLLPGKSIVFRANDPARRIALDWEVTLASNCDAAVFDAKVTNLASSGSLELSSVSPLVTTATASTGCMFGSRGGTNAVGCVLTNGKMYYDPGQLIKFAPGTTEPVDSFFNAAFHVPQSRATLVAGFIDCARGEGHILATPPATGSPAFSLATPSMFCSSVLLGPGKSISSGKLLLLAASDGHAGLEKYADLLGQSHDVHLNGIINGWCTWSVMYGQVSEAEVMRHAEFIARELKPYGMDWIQIDDGFQRGFADWEGQPEKFPNGMKGVGQRIRALGLKPGLWVAPFAISANSPVAREHPDWLVHRANGEIQQIAADHQGQAQYILDVTQPGARQWLRDLFHTISEDWGYDFIKTDFSDWTLLAAERFHNPAVSTSEAYRDGVAAMREGMGPQRHLLDCGPAPTVTGLIDSMRIELDRPVPENPLWDQYAGFYNSTGPAVAKRYYYHGRTWINDADHIRLSGLTLEQGRAAATITALAGGTMISGDRVYALDAERLSILKRVMPAYGKAARPMDLFETDSAELFVLPIDMPFGKWTVAACFNWGKQPRVRHLKLDELGIQPSKDGWLAYDFWSQSPVAITSGVLELQQPAMSVCLLALRPRTGAPQVVGTDRHFTQGAVELADVSWDEKRNELTGTAIGAPDMEWNLAVYVPDGYHVTGQKGFAQKPETTGSLLKAHLKFTSDRAPWSISFSR